MRTELAALEFGSLTGGSPGLFFKNSASSWWPRHPSATEHMRVHMIYGLPAVTAGIEDHPVAGIGDAFGQCHLVRLTGHLGEQPIPGRRQRGQILVVVPRDHQDVHRGLRIDIAKCEGTRRFEHERCRHFAAGDSAE
jgi:hypothetical protein